MTHRSLVEVDDAAGPERPDVVDLDDDLLADGLDQRKFRSRPELDPAEFLPQAGLDRSCPPLGIVTFAGSCSRAALLLAGLERIIGGCRTNDRLLTGGLDDGA